MRIFTPEQELIAIVTEYLKIVSFSYLLTGLSQYFLMIMKIAGYAKLSVWISAMMVAVDVVADIFLVYGVKNFKGFGANVTAYSTIAVEEIALIWEIVWSYKFKEVKLGKTDLFKFSKNFERD